MFVFTSCFPRPSVETAPKTPTADSSPTAQIIPTPKPQLDIQDKPSFSTLGWKTDFSRHSIPYAEIISGGVPRDGIPPIYNPKFETVAEADYWLTDKEPIVALELAGERRAYPLRILIWHEVVNDNVGDIPVVATYCPLRNTAVVFDRRLEGKILTFGVSGLLRHSDLIMWDSKTESLWQQGTGEGIVGEHTGKLLDFFPASIISWQDFKAAFADAKILSRDTGFRRSYGINPYSGYDGSSRPFLFAGNPDPRLPALERVIGIGKGDAAIAYPFSMLAKDGVINDIADSQRLVIFYQPGTLSALDRPQISESQEVGSAAVFSSRVDSRELHFEIREGKITDRETGSQWNILGQAVKGPLAGKSLNPVVHGTHFWFAWAAFNPRTRIYAP